MREELTCANSLAPNTPVVPLPVGAGLTAVSFVAAGEGEGLRLAARVVEGEGDGLVAVVVPLSTVLVAEEEGEGLLLAPVLRAFTLPAPVVGAGDGEVVVASVVVASVLPVVGDGEGDGLLLAAVLRALGLFLEAVLAVVGDGEGDGLVLVLSTPVVAAPVAGTGDGEVTTGPVHSVVERAGTDSSNTRATRKHVRGLLATHRALCVHAVAVVSHATHPMRAAQVRISPTHTTHLQASGWDSG